MAREASRRLRIPLPALAIVIGSVAAWSCGPSPTPSNTPPSEPPTAEPASAGAPPPALPDFAITGYWRDPAEPLPVPPGSKVYFHIKVTNLGTAPYGGYVVVQGPGNYSGGFNGLVPGETKEAVVEFVVRLTNGTVSGNYFLVDPDNIAAELNETNNTLGPLTVVYGDG
jgi:hypothetical protein